MKKRTLSFLLALVMCLSLLPMTAFATEFVNKAAPTITDVEVVYENGVVGNAAGFEITVQMSEENKALIQQMVNENLFLVVRFDYSLDGGDWIQISSNNYLKPTQMLNDLTESDSITVITTQIKGLTAETTVSIRAYFYSQNFGGNYRGEMSEVFTINEKIQGSDWALDELERAEELGLIPDCLEGEDLTQDITRAEFAAVAVKVYEALANGEAIPAVVNPFTDTNDVEVLKAYNIGAVNGTSTTTYSPDALLNREQAATMLTRVFKKITLAGWTLPTDSQFTLNYTKPAAFADDADISDWAKDSVYFMAANGIINGVGNNKFAPKNVTTEEQATGYANATREQALLIAVRMVENLGS